MREASPYDLRLSCDNEDSLKLIMVFCKSSIERGFISDTFACKLHPHPEIDFLTNFFLKVHSFAAYLTGRILTKNIIKLPPW